MNSRPRLTHLDLHRLTFVGIAVQLLLACAQAPGRSGPEERDLLLGQPLELVQSSAEAHSLRLPAKRGWFYKLKVLQHGVDLRIHLIDPHGSSIFAINGLTGGEGAERIEVVASESGHHRLEFEALYQTTGEFVVHLEAERPAGQMERQRDRAARAFFAGDALRGARKHRAALEAYRKGETLWNAESLREEAEAQIWRAETSYRIGLCHYALRHESDDDLHRASDAFGNAARLFLATGEKFQRGQVLNHLGNSRCLAGEIEAAINDYGLALEISDRLQDRFSTAVTRGNRAQCLKTQGKIQEALDDYLESLELFRSLADRGREARQLHNLGVLYRLMGSWKNAASHLQQAEMIWQDLDLPRNQATTLNQLGQLSFAQGHLGKARESYQRALELRQQMGDEIQQARTLTNIGELQQLLENLAGAKASYHRAQELYERKEGNPAGRAKLSLKIGTLLLGLGDFDRALAAFEEARQLYRDRDDALGQADSFLGIARAQRRQHRVEAAQATILEAVEIVETIRRQSPGRNLRAEFFATAQPVFELAIELAIDQGDNRAALVLADQATARSLLDLSSLPVTMGRRDGQREEEEEEEEEERRAALPHRLGLEKQIRNLAWRLANSPDLLGKDRNELQKKKQGLLADLGRMEDQRIGAEGDPILTVEQIQNLLDDGSMLLQYRLGTQRSHLWTVTQKAVSYFELPRRETVERVAEKARRSLEHSSQGHQARRGDSARTELSQLTLGPAATELEAHKKISIIADGALRYIPFAALPVPTPAPAKTTTTTTATATATASHEMAPLLVEQHQISYLPSVSVMKTLRARHQDRPPGERRVERKIAILADPVFARDGNPDSDFPPLPWTHEEARAIQALADEPLVATRHDANEAWVRSGRLAGYPFLHFATHGEIDLQRPELSMLVLSQFDHRGRRRDGFLRAHEIADLRLSAELVVLSGCETGLGQELGGEGLVGLTQPFFAAGATRVLVSLWPVADDSTAHLMKEFYQSLWRDDLAPASALQKAQLALRRDPEYASPFHWAGFVLQGEPRPLSAP